MLPKLIPFLLLYTVAVTCSLQTHGQEKIYFDPKFSSGGRQSDFITCSNFVLLETTSESRFDKYSGLMATKRFFVVFDYSAKKILVFDKTGRFIKKFGNKLDFGRLTYNEEKDRLEMVSSNKAYRLTNKDNAEILEDYKNPKNRKYFRKYFIELSDTLHFVVHKQKIEQSDILNPIPYTNGMHFVNKVTVDKNYANSQDYELKIYRGDTLLQQYFPYDKKKDSRYIFDGASVAITAAAAPDARWVTHPYDYTIYALKKDSLYKAWEFVLPLDRAIAPDFFAREFQNRTEKDNYLRQNRKLVKQVYASTLSERYMRFTLQSMQYEQQQFVYDTKTKTFYNYDKINPDSLTYFLPVCKNMSFTDGPQVYARIAADEALKIFEVHKKDNIQYPPILEAYFKTATPESNPVLIHYNFRN